MSTLITTDTKPKESKTAHLKRQALGWIDRVILVLMRVLIWSVLIGIIAIDIAAVLVTLVVIFQDDLPLFVVDFVRDILLAGQSRARLTLQMVNLDGLADMARDGLKALALLWVGVTALTLGATWLAHTAWQRKYKKATPTKGKGAAASSSEVIMPLMDPLLLEMDDEFSRYIHRYSFNLDLRCRTPQDAAGVNAWIDALKTTLSNELVSLAKGSIVQVRREEAIAALSAAAQSVSGGAIVGVILRGSDYIRLNKPPSAAPAEAPPAGQKARVKMSTSWGAKAHSDIGAPPASGPLSAPPAPSAATEGAGDGAARAGGGSAAGEAAEEPPPAPPAPRPIAGIDTEQARNLLAGIRG